MGLFDFHLALPPPSPSPISIYHHSLPCLALHLLHCASFFFLLTAAAAAADEAPFSLFGSFIPLAASLDSLNPPQLFSSS